MAPCQPSQCLLEKVAIITGASSGLGRAIALAFAREGAIVVCADLDPIASVHMNDGDPKATHKIIGEKNGTSIFVKCNVDTSQNVQDLVNEAVQEYGRLDIREPWNPAPIYEASEEAFGLTARVNSRGVFLGCKYASKQMITQEPYPSGDRGWIINTASVLGLVGNPQIVAYASSKGSVVSMTKTVALDLAPDRIHCNALRPGLTNTPFIRDLTQDVRDHFLAPFRGVGEPEDIAKVAVFLASDDASWITGVPLPVDGGFIAL